MNSVELLKENGFVVVRGAVDPALCKRAIEAVTQLKRENLEVVQGNADEFGHLYRVVNLHLAVDELLEAFATNKQGLAVCDGFFEKPTSLYTTLYYERGSEQPLHRDTPYFCTKPAAQYLGVWLALDDVDEGNGPLMVVPKSHRLPVIDIRQLRQQVFAQAEVPANSVAGWNAYQGAVQAQCDEQGLAAEPVHVQQGDVIIWHPETFHGGAAHLDKLRSRRSFVMHVTPVGVPVYHMDVFYDPDRQVPEHAPWAYNEHLGRKYAVHGQIDFGHAYAVQPQVLRQKTKSRLAKLFE